MARQPFPGTITSIEAQAKTRRHLGTRVNVFVNDKFSFALDATLAEQRGLRPGVLLEEAALADLLNEDGTAKAYSRALHFLSYRPRSAEEIRARLERDEWPEQVIERVLQRLQKEQFVNDANFAAIWVENRSITRPRGAFMLRHELRQKGVQKEDIESALPAADEELENAVEATRRKHRSWQRFEPAEQRQKAIQFLQRRGFNYGIAKAAWERLQEEDQP